MEHSNAALELDACPRDHEAHAPFDATTYGAWHRWKEPGRKRPFCDQHTPGNERAFVRSLVDQHRMPRGARLIDLGCGNGFYANEFANAGLRVTGADMSESAIGYARRMHERQVEWIAGDALTLPFDSEFDYGFCHDFTLSAAAEVPRHEVELGRAMMRYLRPGGTLLCVWHGDLAAIRLRGGKRFGIMSDTIRQIEAAFPDFRVTSHAIDGMARMTAYFGRHAYNNYITRLCSAGVDFAASSWHCARIIVAVHK